MELASHDPFHRLRQQFMCYARFLKWTGSWPEALNEIDRIEEQVAAKLEEHEREPVLFTKYLKLNARLLKERMIILAMTKRFEEAGVVCENWRALMKTYPEIANEWKLITADYLVTLYFKSLDNQQCIVRLLDNLERTSKYLGTAQSFRHAKILLEIGECHLNIDSAAGEDNPLKLQYLERGGKMLVDVFGSE